MAQIRNKRAFFDYEILDRVTAGISLLGPEVKSLRAGRGSLVGSFISIRDGQAYMKNCQIPKWEFSQENIDPLRDRKLLLKKKEILRLQKKLDEQGYTIIPLSVFFKNGYAKVEIALGKGKKQYDKRATIKKRDEERRIAGKMKKH